MIVCGNLILLFRYGGREGSSGFTDLVLWEGGAVYEEALFSVLHDGAGRD